eukprot:763673-Hanusia_phi.AAC.3
MKRRREEEEGEEEGKDVEEREELEDIEESFIEPELDEEPAHHHHLIGSAVPGGHDPEQDELNCHEVGSSDDLQDTQHANELNDAWGDVDLERELNSADEVPEEAGEQVHAAVCEDAVDASGYEVTSPMSKRNSAYDMDVSLASQACSSSHVRMLEESIVVEVGTRNRYKLQLEAEMEKNAKASARIASLQTENEHLQARSSDAEKNSAAKDVLLRNFEAEISALKRQLLERSSEADTEHKAKISRLQSEMFDKSKEVLRLQRELELCQLSEGELKEKVAGLEKRVSSLVRNLETPAEPSAVAADSEETLRSQVKEGEILAKHLRLQLLQLKAEAAKAAEFQKELVSLRSIKFEAEEASSRCSLLESKLMQSTANESKLMAEKERLQDWEVPILCVLLRGVIAAQVSLKLCMPDCRSPSDVVDAFRRMQQRNLLLEADLATLREKCSK